MGGMRGGMGMGGGMRGMQGMQGQQGMQQQMMMPPPEEEEVPLREKEISQALEFVDKPEVKLTGEEDEEEREKKMTQITQYLEKNMGLTEDELNTVLKRSGIDPTAGDSDDDFKTSSDSEEEEDEKELDYDEQQISDMRGSIPMPLLLSLIALFISVPNHRNLWDWIMGDPPKRLAGAIPLQQQLWGAGGFRTAGAGGPTSAPSVVVINQPPFGSSGYGGAVAAASWGRRFRWLLLLGALLAIGRGWFIYKWTARRPQMRALIFHVATKLDMKVENLVIPDPDDTDEDLRKDVRSLQLQLRELRSNLLTNKFQANRLLADAEAAQQKELAATSAVVQQQSKPVTAPPTPQTPVLPRPNATPQTGQTVA